MVNRQKTEDRRQKTEDRRQKTEPKILHDCISVVISLEEPVSIPKVVLVDIPEGGLEVVFYIISSGSSVDAEHRYLR